jgi:hypothetical protein
VGVGKFPFQPFDVASCGCCGEDPAASGEHLTVSVLQDPLIARTTLPIRQEGPGRQAEVRQSCAVSSRGHRSNNCERTRFNIAITALKSADNQAPSVSIWEMRKSEAPPRP